MAPLKLVFADTSYFVALFSTGGPEYVQAVKVAGTLRGVRIVTSDYVHIELLNHARKWRADIRRLAIEAIQFMRTNEADSVVPHSGAVFDEATKLMAERLDKDWSFVDCTSFVIMWQRGIRQALSADHHFEQAGFERLLR